MGLIRFSWVVKTHRCLEQVPVLAARKIVELGLEQARIEQWSFVYANAEVAIIVLLGAGVCAKSRLRNLVKKTAAKVRKVVHLGYASALQWDNAYPLQTNLPLRCLNCSPLPPKTWMDSESNRADPQEVGEIVQAISGTCCCYWWECVSSGGRCCWLGTCTAIAQKRHTHAATDALCIPTLTYYHYY